MMKRKSINCPRCGKVEIWNWKDNEELIRNTLIYTLRSLRALLECADEKIPNLYQHRDNAAEAARLLSVWVSRQSRAPLKDVVHHSREWHDEHYGASGSLIATKRRASRPCGEN